MFPKSYTEKASHPRCFFHARKEKPMEQKAKEILLEKLEEMAEVTPDAFDDLQSYAVLCSAMAEMCNAITQKA